MNLAIILAGGEGKRAGSEQPKQFVPIGNREMIAHTIQRFQDHKQIDSISVVIHPEYVDRIKTLIGSYGFTKVENVLSGGPQRQDSARIGVFAAENDKYRNILIHDGARPLVDGAIIQRVIETLDTESAVNVAVPAADTIVRVDKLFTLQDVPPRSSLMCAQTPQGFRADIIKKAHQMAIGQGMVGSSDDCSLVHHFRLAAVKVVQGSPANIKITHPQDFIIATALIQK